MDIWRAKCNVLSATISDVEGPGSTTSRPSRGAGRSTATAHRRALRRAGRSHGPSLRPARERWSFTPASTLAAFGGLVVALQLGW